jgi:hypothetical protein
MQTAPLGMIFGYTQFMTDALPGTTIVKALFDPKLLVVGKVQSDKSITRTSKRRSKRGDLGAEADMRGGIKKVTCRNSLFFVDALSRKYGLPIPVSNFR